MLLSVKIGVTFSFFSLKLFNYCYKAYEILPKGNFPQRIKF